MTLEQVLLKLGIDGSQIQSGLDTARNQVTRWAHGVSSSIAESFKSVLGPALGIGIGAFLERTLATVREIKTTAAAAGVSTDFIQDLQNIGKAAGLAREQVDMMFGRFLKTVNEGESPEEAFYKFADSIAAIPDPAERARMAIERFGRSGFQMLKMIQGGSEGMKQIAAGFSKFTSEEIENLHIVEHETERAESKVMKFLGGGISNLVTTIRAFGRMGLGGGRSFGKVVGEIENEDISEINQDDREKSAAQRSYAKARAQEEHNKAIEAYRYMLDDLVIKTGTWSQQQDILNKRMRQAEKDMKENGDEPIKWLEAAHRYVSLQEQLHSLGKQEQSRLEAKARKDEQERQKELAHKEKMKQLDMSIAESQRQISRQAVDMAVAKYGRFTPTVEDYANSGYWAPRGNNGAGFVWQPGPLAGIAQRMRLLQHDAFNSLLWGNTDRHKRDIDEYDKLHDAMSQAGLLTPEQQMSDIAESTKKAEAHLSKLIERKAAILVSASDEDGGGDDD